MPLHDHHELNQIPFVDRDDPALAHEISHFRSVPLAASTLEDQSFKPISISRHLTHDGSGHSLMAGTFNTPDTISRLLSFFRPPSRPFGDIEAFTNADVNEAEVRRFYTLGNGLNAHAGLLHGGVIACLLDSTMSNAAGLTLRSVLDLNDTVFTVQLNVRYEKPVRTPGNIMVRAWVDRVEGGGRKIWVAAEVRGGENGDIGHARAEGLWLKARVEKL